MKFRDSGMPTEELWDSFFNPKHILESLEFKDIENYIDIGSGYGTFLIPASTMISGKAIGIDVNKSYLEICEKRIRAHDLKNIHLIMGDISRKQTIQNVSDIIPKADYISLFNILHCEEPVVLLKNTRKLLKNKGKIGIIHWIYEDTPRGPALNIRPRPEYIIKWASEIGLTFKKQVELPSYHFGLLFENIELLTT